MEQFGLSLPIYFVREQQSVLGLLQWALKWHPGVDSAALILAQILSKGTTLIEFFQCDVGIVSASLSANRVTFQLTKICCDSFIFLASYRYVRR